MRAPEGVVQEMSSPSVVQWAAGHDYKTNVAFNCMATSGTAFLLPLSDRPSRNYMKGAACEDSSSCWLAQVCNILLLGDGRHCSVKQLEQAG